MRRIFLSVLTVPLTLVAMGGCNADPPIPQAENAQVAPVSPTPTPVSGMNAPAPTLKNPMGMPSSHPTAMPAGHPPIPPGTVLPGAAAPSSAATGPLAVEGVIVTPPQGWVAETPNNRMRMRQFALPRVDGDSADGVVTIVVAGGDVASNIARWRGQFKEKTDPLMAKTQVAGREVTLVEIAGTFLWKASPMAPGAGEERADYIVRGVIIPGEGGRHVFVKGWGPAKTMIQWKPSFENLANTLKAVGAAAPK
ncbi:MAG: hypothetical protein ACI9MR_004758 [Myxococcota bacterium]|jgi:hypothetical protein